MVVTTVIMFGRAVWLRRRGIDAWAHDQVGMFLGMVVGSVDIVVDLPMI